MVSKSPPGSAVPPGVAHVALRGRRTWAEERAAEAATLGIDTQPYCVIVGVWTGRHRAGGAAQAPGRTDAGH